MTSPSPECASDRVLDLLLDVRDQLRTGFGDDLEALCFEFLFHVSVVVGDLGGIGVALQRLVQHSKISVGAIEIRSEMYGVLE